jgi:alpha-L-rhamnosidase
MDVYVDTAVRERGPYEGDMYVNQLGQYAIGGGLPLARYSGEYLTHRPTWPSEYQLMPPICAWADYLATGDDRQLRSDYTSWCDAMLALSDLDLVRKEPGAASSWGADLVDWPITNRDGYVFTEVSTVLNAFQCAAYRALGQIAQVLGRVEDQRRFASLAAAMQAALTEHLLDDRAHGYRDGAAVEHHAQHATAVPVALGLAPPARLRELGETLVAQGMSTGIYAAQFVLDALYTCGQPDAARALMTAPAMPGWVDAMDRLGATLTPEAWDPSLKPNMTFSHAWGTAPANVVMRHLVGVQVVEPGAARVLVRPQPGSLAWFDAAFPTIRGQVAVAYRRDGDGGATTRVELPPGMVGTLVLPEAGTRAVDLQPGVTEVRQG